MIATFSGDHSARLWLGTLDAESPERRLIYRKEDQVYGIEPQSSVSHELSEADAIRTIAQFELRRAAYHWPEGFEWKADGTSYVTSIAGGHGTLRVTCSDTVAATAAEEDDRPVTFHSELSPGEEFERYADLVWADDQLSGLTLTAGGQAIWTERLETFDSRARYVSSYFLPADRRTGRTALGEAMAQTALRLELPQRTVLQASFESLLREDERPPQSVDEARQAAQRALQRIENESPLDLEPGYAIEFDAESHRPLTLLLWPLSEGTVPDFQRGDRSQRTAVGLLLTPRELSDPAQSLPQI
ncbi:MAG: hypothetical protein AAF368_11300, partial [Planctomycetota bacterium]